MELFMEWFSVCATFPNDRWRGLSVRLEDAECKRESESGLSPTAVPDISKSLGQRPEERTGRGDEGGPLCGLIAPGRWFRDQATCWVSTLAGCERCAGHRCMSSQQLHRWLLRAILCGQTLNAHQCFPVFPLCFAWRNPNSAGSAKIRD